MSTQWKNLRLWLIKHQAISNSVKKASEIKRLDLSSLSLESLPENFSLLEDLVILNLSNNKLSELPLSLKSLQKLNNLDIRRNAFKYIPLVLSDLKLGSINLSGNQINDANSLFDCKSLRVCDLSFNNLNKLSFNAKNHRNLRTLNLCGNFFKEIPEDLGKLEELQRLNLSQNILQEVSPVLASLHELIDINLSDNQIESIDESFYTLVLESIDLSANALKELFLRGLEDLESLTLDENPLKKIMLSDDFAPYLQEFSCDSCLLEYFVPFSSKRLESLCFSSNKISEIPGFINQYENLTQLDIENNLISELPYNMTNMTRLQTLYIAGNPLNEDSKEVIKILHPDICDQNMKTGIEIEEASADDLTQLAEMIGFLLQI